MLAIIFSNNQNRHLYVLASSCLGIIAFILAFYFLFLKFIPNVYRIEHLKILQASSETMQTGTFVKVEKDVTLAKYIKGALVYFNIDGKLKCFYLEAMEDIFEKDQEYTFSTRGEYLYSVDKRCFYQEGFLPKDFFMSKDLFLKWPWLIVLSLCAICVSSFTINFSAYPKKEKRLFIFAAHYADTSEALYSRLNQSPHKPDYLQLITLITGNLSSSQFDTQLITNGLPVADILFLPESIVTNEMCGMYFNPIDVSYASRFSDEFIYKKMGDKEILFGIQIHQSGDNIDPKNDLFTFYKDGEEDQNYYAFFGKNSIHLGDMVNSRYDTSFNLLMDVLNYAI
ncbi:MAG: hypothetical protein ACOX3K_00765 [Bacilli bacterium]